MPDAVRVAQPLQLVEDVEQDAESVGDAAGGEPPETVSGKRVPEAAQIEGTGPAHAEVDQHLADFHRAPAEQNLAQNARQGERPDDGQYDPAVAVAQTDERERGIGAGNQQVNRYVIENPEDLFQLRRMKTVIQRRHGIQQHHGYAEHGETGDDPAIACLDADRQQRAEADQRENRADQVADTVESFAVVHRLSRKIEILDRTPRLDRATGRVEPESYRAACGI